MVDARQCVHAETVATDMGFVHVAAGEWVVRGEGGECYVMEDAAFRRLFRAMAVEEKPVRAEREGKRRVLKFRASLRKRMHAPRLRPGA